MTTVTINCRHGVFYSLKMPVNSDYKSVEDMIHCNRRQPLVKGQYGRIKSALYTMSHRKHASYIFICPIAIA